MPKGSVPEVETVPDVIEQEESNIKKEDAERGATRAPQKVTIPKGHLKSVGRKETVKRIKSRQMYTSSSSHSVSVDAEFTEKVLLVLQMISKDDITKGKSKLVEKSKSKESRLKSNMKIRSKTKIRPKSDTKMRVKSKGMSKDGKGKPKSKGMAKSKLTVKDNSAMKVAPPQQPSFAPYDPQTLELMKCLLQKMVNMAGPPTLSVSPPPTIQYVTEQKQLEELYDAMFELSNDMKTLQDSYQQIVKSLINLQKRRVGPKEKKTQALPLLDPSNTKLNTTSVSTNESITSHELNMERFMNPSTRSEAFRQLMASFDALKAATQQFMSCFDSAGYIDLEKYNNNPVSVNDRDAWLNDARSLHSTVSAILQEYNREVLDMFRIQSTL